MSGKDIEMKQVGDGLYEVKNARTAAQAEVMVQAAKEKRCIFCDVDFSINKPLNRLGEFDPEGKDWPLLWVWENPFPQEHQSHHIMILPKTHIDNNNFHKEVTEELWLQILDARKWAVEFFNLRGGGAIDRFGERSLNAGTVDHWHFQLMIPDGTGNVKATLCKDRSPENEARRANEKAYFKDTVTGYVYMNKFGLFLGENFRWQRAMGPEKSFVHAEAANKHILAALCQWGEKEIIDSVWHATWKKDEGVTLTGGALDPTLIKP